MSEERRPQEMFSQTLRIVLADDHEIVRGGLKLLLEAEPDIEVVAEAGDIDAVRTCVRHHRPTVLVLDLNMPGKPVLDAIPGLRAEAPDTQIVVLTMRDDAAFVEEARRAGALGYVLKEAAGSELIDAIRRAADRQPYINRHLAGRLVAQRMRRSSWD
jgi:two-component system, NarL family, response regulator NreC